MKEGRRAGEKEQEVQENYERDVEMKLTRGAEKKMKAMESEEAKTTKRMKNEASYRPRDRIQLAVMIAAGRAGGGALCVCVCVCVCARARTLEEGL